MDDKVIWGAMGEFINLGKISVTVHKTPASNNTLDIIITIENNHTVTYALSNYNQRFYLANELVCTLPFSFNKMILTEPSSKKDMIEEQCQTNNLQILPIKVKHISALYNFPLRLGEPPFFHKEPFDRILIAQAVVENAHLVSADSVFKNYQVKLLW